MIHVYTPWKHCFVLFPVLMCSDSIFKSVKKVTDGSFLFLCQPLVFLFLAFLFFSVQIRCPKNRYTNLKSALHSPWGNLQVGGFPPPPPSRKNLASGGDQISPRDIPAPLVLATLVCCSLWSVFYQLYLLLRLCLIFSIQHNIACLLCKGVALQTRR